MKLNSKIKYSTSKLPTLQNTYLKYIQLYKTNKYLKLNLKMI